MEMVETGDAREASAFRKDFGILGDRNMKGSG